MLACKKRPSCIRCIHSCSKSTHILLKQMLSCITQKVHCRCVEGYRPCYSITCSNVSLYQDKNAKPRYATTASPIVWSGWYLSSMLRKRYAISSRTSQLKCHSSQYPGGLPPEPADQLSAVSIVVYIMTTIPKQQSKTSAMRCHGLVATALR